MKKVIVCLLLLLSFTGCTNQSAVDNSDKKWITYQKVVVGETKATEVEKLLGAPFDKTELSEQETVYYQYSGYSVIAQNGKVTTITIKSETAPMLENGIAVGSTKGELLALLPAEPEIVKYTEFIPEGVGKNNADTLRMYCLVEYSSDGAEILSQNIIVLLSDGSMVDCSINQKDIVEKITIVAPNE